VHTLFEVRVKLFDAYWLEVQTAASLQPRSLCQVGTSIWYWLDEQTVMASHTRSDVVVGICDRKCVFKLQIVSALHARFELDVGAVTSYSQVVLQTEMALHTG